MQKQRMDFSVRDRMGRLFTVLAAILVLVGWTGPPAWATDYDTDDDTLIEISNLAQLNAIRWDMDGDGSVDADTNAAAYQAAFPGAVAGMGCPTAGCDGYELTVDLDFDTNANGEADAGDAYWNHGRGWVPIRGRGKSYFSAVLDGNGHTISNLYIGYCYSGGSARDWNGLFSVINSTGEIHNVGLESVDIFIPAVGCYQTDVGSLVGLNQGIISNSYATGSVSAGPRGLAGGLVSFNYGSISASYATTDIVSAGGSAGGLVSSNYGSISASYATGSVTAGSGGGLVSLNSSFSRGGHISASYATGSVTVGLYGGGLVGSLVFGSHISASYATGSVTLDPDLTPTGYEDNISLGGLVGWNQFSKGTVTDSYWNKKTSGLTTSAGGVGKGTVAMKRPTGYTGIYANWNVDVDGDDIPDDPWSFGTRGHLPVLQYDFLSDVNQRPVLRRNKK